MFFAVYFCSLSQLPITSEVGLQIVVKTLFITRKIQWLDIPVSVLPKLKFDLFESKQHVSDNGFCLFCKMYICNKTLASSVVVSEISSPYLCMVLLQFHFLLFKLSFFFLPYCQPTCIMIHIELILILVSLSLASIVYSLLIVPHLIVR